MDDVPGFGVSAAASWRDETISYWEAWRRDTGVESCMREAGFVWTPEVQYPEDVVVGLAKHLGIAALTTPVDGTAPDEMNRQRVRAMPAQRANAYFMSLLGESAEDMEYLESHDGAVPPGRPAQEFANGGCKGTAARQVGSIWNLRRELTPDLVKYREASRETAGFEAGRLLYVECAADVGVGRIESPADLDSIAAIDKYGLDKLTQVQQQCSPLWDTAVSTGLSEAFAAFRASHLDTLQAQRLRYSEVTTGIEQDAEFERFVARTVTRVTQARGNS